MSPVSWYWHRLRAMDAAEIIGRVRKKSLEIADTRRTRDWTSVPLKAGQTYPRLPAPKDAPESFRDALRRDTEQILAGKWRAFGHIPIRVSDPPQWHKDYLADVDLPTNESAFKLNHRLLPKGADIKLIWELSRWHHLTRLALAAYLLDDVRAARKCVHWLEHWAQHNPPYRGWNWTSALEAGFRLIQFTWIEALLQPFVEKEQCDAEFDQLRYEILPAHVWFTWRHRSFGSSANNHLLGELAGLILATVRWPELTSWGAILDELQTMWEREVLAQFAEDGGNREQALNYHLVSFELCWHAANALRAAGRTLAPQVLERLQSAGDFFRNVQIRSDHWDYGDSDDACVLPLSHNPPEDACEWLEGKSAALSLFWNAPPQPPRPSAVEKLPDGWRHFPHTGIATNAHGQWFLRLDASPLGYLATAAHGHLDALHLSIWLDGVAMIIDPGTGAYEVNPQLRDWLASRGAHNGPAFALMDPRRLGPFLWSTQHPIPTLSAAEDGGVAAQLRLSAQTVRRRITRSQQENAWIVDDRVSPGAVFSVRWQFGPETNCQIIEPRRFKIVRHNRTLEIRLSDDWDAVDLVVAPSDAESSLAGTVSPNFRHTTWAPYLNLVARPERDEPCVFQTTFLASHH